MARLFVIGGGNMGSAIVRGGIRAGILTTDSVVVVEPDESRRQALASLGIECKSDAAAALGLFSAGDRVLIAVKPQVFPQVAPAVAAAVSRSGSVISIMAGLTTSAIAAALTGASAAGGLTVIRVMPNLPAMIGKGVTAIATNHPAPRADMEFTRSVFSALGKVISLDESLLDAFTAIAGSGPAYVYYLAQAMEEAALSLGLTQEDAATAVRQTIIGAAGLLESTDKSAVTLRAEVTSKGGTTAAATSVLDDARVREIFARALTAARDRGRELSRPPA